MQVQTDSPGCPSMGKPKVPVHVAIIMDHTPTLWPDLDASELEQALASFSHRQRRFGRLSPED